jgi:hypothetical protein
MDGDRRSIARIDDHRRPDRRPIEERLDSRRRQVDSAAAGERPILGGGAQRRDRLPARIVQPFAVPGEPQHHLHHGVRIRARARSLYIADKNNHRIAVADSETGTVATLIAD